MKRWPTKPLGEVAEFVNGRAFKPSEWTSKGIPIIRIQNLTDPAAPANRFDGSFDERNAVRNGELLVSWSATLDVFFWDRGDAVLNQHIFRVVPDSSQVHKPYLFYALKSVMEELRSKTHGATMKHITKGPFEKTVIPVPPLAEQLRIVKLLDEADELRKLRTQADRHTATLLPALFHEMFADELQPRDGCVVTSVGELLKDGSLRDIQDGNHGEIHPKAAEYTTKGVPFVFANHISNKELDLSTCPYLTNDRARKLRVGFARPNDVLLSHKGSIGFTAVVPPNVEMAVLSPQVTYYRFDAERIDPAYAWGYFQTATFQSTLERLSRQATRAYVGITRQKELPFLIPPMPLQKEFAQRVTEIRALETAQAASGARLGALFESTLHRAFAGEL